MEGLKSGSFMGTPYQLSWMGLLKTVGQWGEMGYKLSVVAYKSQEPPKLAFSLRDRHALQGHHFVGHGLQ